MATRNTPKNTVREDPPETMLDPSLEQLMLVNPDGTKLKNGKYNSRFEYVWINRSQQTQFARYIALGYRPVRRRDDEVRPMAATWTDFEDVEGEGSSNDGAIIERAGVTLVKRPVEMMHRQIAHTREVTAMRKGQIATVNPQDQAVARGGAAVIRPMNMGAEDDVTFG